MKRLMILLLCVALQTGALEVLSQSNVMSAGGDSSSPSGSVSFSIGQVDYIQASSSSGSMSQGVQQPFEIFQIIGVEELTGEMNISAFPNPTNSFVQIQLDGNNSNLQLHLYDAIGNLIQSTNMNAIQTTLDLSSFANGIYYLRVLNAENKQVKTIKLIKTH